MTPDDMIWVGVGGALGSFARWSIGRLVSERIPGARLPLGTFIVNVSGAFVIGYLAILFGYSVFDRYGSFLKAGVITGFLGGYTTFSSMQLDSATLRTTAGARAAALYLFGSVAAGVAAAALGAALAGWEGNP